VAKEAGADVLLVDDEPNVLSALKRVLLPLDIAVEATADARHAAEILAERPPRVLVTDYNMPVMDGVAVLKEARRVSPDTVRILLTAGADPRQIVEAINVGRIFRFVAKPWDDGAFASLVNEAIEAHDLVRRQASAEAERHSLRMTLRRVRKLQLELCPRAHVALESGEAACTSTPCEHATGDYVDVLPLGRGRTALLVGDVAGHGVEAALFVFAARALVRSGLDEGAALPEVVARTNRLLCRDMSGGRFLTLFAAVHDAGEDLLEYVNAGHVPAIVARPGGTQELERTGLPLGLVEDARHEVRRLAFGPEDLLFAYTDGLTEARDQGNEFFGTERVMATLAGIPSGRPSDQLRAVTDALLAFAGEDAARDDLTLLAYRPRRVRARRPVAR
jgi:sigma-B regulation protein RsbU (phosphoserine phosphatase)